MGKFNEAEVTVYDGGLSLPFIRSLVSREWYEKMAAEEARIEKFPAEDRSRECRHPDRFNSGLTEQTCWVCGKRGRWEIFQ